MNLKTLKKLLDISNRTVMFNEILDFIESLNDLEQVSSEIHEISEGKIPIIWMGKNSDINEIKYLKIFIGAQHNEYNGLFGILEIFEQLKNDEHLLREFLIEQQVILFAPLMNPFGFLNPSKENKSGYYLRNGANLNRFWRKTFIPEFETNEKEVGNSPIPDHAKLIKNMIKPYWDREDIKIYIIDFHETSLLYRFPRELSMKLSTFYKFDHWLKEAIIKNILNLNDIKHHEKPLFYKCNSSADHTHLNLSIKQVDLIREKLFEYLVVNQDKLSFYFAHSRRSEDVCSRLVSNIYKKLETILWETTFPIHDHKFHDHGCLVKMNDATTRNNLYCMELENQKQFFNIFEEIERSNVDGNYFNDKLEMINKSLILVKQTIMELIKSF